MRARPRGCSRECPVTGCPVLAPLGRETISPPSRTSLRKSQGVPRPSFARAGDHVAPSQTSARTRITIDTRYHTATIFEFIAKALAGKRNRSSEGPNLAQTTQHHSVLDFGIDIIHPRVYARHISDPGSGSGSVAASPFPPPSHRHLLGLAVAGCIQGPAEPRHGGHPRL